MKKNQLLGIEDLLKEKKTLELKDIVKVHYRLMRNYPMPSIKIEEIEECKPGSPVSLRIKDMPAPGVDVYKGEFIESNRNDLGLSVFAFFRTTTGTSLKPLRQKKKDQFSVILPEKVTNGLMGLIFPIQENFGPKEIVNEFPNDIQNWINRSKHVSRSTLTKDDCPTLPTSSQDFRYLAMIAPQPLRFSFSVTCTICPFGAIKIMPTYCYVDPLVCRGQKYSRLNGTVRGPEEICWNCFNAGDGIVSTKCDYVTLRKVLHLNPDYPIKEVPCCGGCELPSLCHRGAISKPTTYFTCNKKICNGCGDCYSELTCAWNCGTMCSSDCDKYGYCNYHNNYTMRMVAQIDEKLRLALVAARAFRVEDFWFKQFSDWDFAFDTDEYDFSEFNLMIWGDKQERIPIKLDKTGVQKLDLREIPFTKSVHLGLFEADGKLLGFSYCGANMPIKSLGAKRYSDPTKLVDRGTFDFYTPMGGIQIEYLIKEGDKEGFDTKKTF